MIVACVRTGTSYHFEYVTKLRNMVARHLHCRYEMVCLTDQPERCEGINFIDVAEIGLKSWWAKLILFAPEWRALHKVVYCDLDTVIIKDITPLAGVPGEFSILESPVRREGIDYPCKYNSSVMVIGGGQCEFMWAKFEARRAALIELAGNYGDQKVIEELYPEAQLLNQLMPKGFFCNYRHLTMHQPRSAIINFGGKHKPHVCPIPWVQEAWV